MTVQELLEAARELYATAPDHCPQERIPELGYCPITAVGAVAGDNYWAESESRYKALLHMTKACGGSISGFNAECSTDEVLAAFDEAIRMAGA